MTWRVPEPELPKDWNVNTLTVPQQRQVLLHLLSCLFPSRRAALRWMLRRVPALSHKRPISYVIRGDYRPVISLLGAIEHGVFT